MTNLQQLIQDAVETHKTRSDAAAVLVKRWVDRLAQLVGVRVPCRVLPLSGVAGACTWTLSLGGCANDAAYLPIIGQVLRGGDEQLDGSIRVAWEVRLTVDGLSSLLQGVEHEPHRLKCAKAAVEVLTYLTAYTPPAV